MNFKKIGLAALLFFSPLSLNGQSPKITPEKINEYVMSNSGSIKNEYSDFINDSIGEFYFSSSDLGPNERSDGEGLGIFSYFAKEAIINNRGNFLEFEKKNLQGKLNDSSNAFVKAAMIHELSHNYFSDLSLKLKKEGADVCSQYIPQVGFNINKSSYGAQFIEEGFCEYIANKMGETYLEDNISSPKNLDQLEKNKETYEIKYEYSAYFLKDFLDKYGIKQGHRILVTNSPPTKEEILNPKKYFERLTDTRPAHLKLIIKNNQKPLN